MEEEMNFQLSNLLKFSKKGSFEETGTITFEPPSMQSFDEASDFEQIFMGAVISAGNVSGSGKEKSDEVEDQNAMDKLMDNVPTAQEIKMLLFISQDVKVRDLAKVFKKLACKTAKLDGSEKLKDSHFDKMSRDDFIRMICEYASFFTFPSLLRGESQEKDGSQLSAT